MDAATDTFYDDLADYYHLIFEDWNRSIDKQAAILGPLLEQYANRVAPRVLDCACGIGTQTLGLSMRGHHLIGSDLSRASVARAEKEAVLRGLKIQFYIADMRNLSPVREDGFDVVLAADNALPHLLIRKDRDQTLREMAGKLRPGGILVATIRDYDHLIQTRPAIQAPSFYGIQGQRRIVHQIWDWDGNEYDVHLYISLETSTQWIVQHYVSRYHALLRNDLTVSLQEAGFTTVQWLEPSETSFYQPVVIARK
ncbi:MAG: Methyltransferase type 11 [Acidobacteriaceae bacterium]|nr:Methyltransferase type 11 [Acidobacteriaceae bacterium]